MRRRGTGKGGVERGRDRGLKILVWTGQGGEGIVMARQGLEGISRDGTINLEG